MTTIVNRENKVTIPAEVGRRMGIKPGSRLDRQPVEGSDEILVRVIPDRGRLARRLLGAGRALSTERDAGADLVGDRAADIQTTAAREDSKFPRTSTTPIDQQLMTLSPGFP